MDGDKKTSSLNLFHGFGNDYTNFERYNDKDKDHPIKSFELTNGAPSFMLKEFAEEPYLQEHIAELKSLDAAIRKCTPPPTASSKKLMLFA